MFKWPLMWRKTHERVTVEMDRDYRRLYTFADDIRVKYHELEEELSGEREKKKKQAKKKGKK